MNKNTIYYYRHGEEIDSNFKYLEAREDIQRILDYATKDMDDMVSMSIHICNSEHIKELNKEHREKDSSTDVLSFPHGEMDEGYLYIGDIFINEDILESQAKEINSDPLMETKFLAMHGILHLLGYDHIDEKLEEEMTSKQREIFRELKIREW